MNVKYLLCMLASLSLVACSSTSVNKVYNSSSNKRIEEIKQIAVDRNFLTDNFYDVSSMFQLMMSIQNGTIKTSDLEGGIFYFRDPVGKDTGSGWDSSYFECIQIIDTSVLEDNEDVTLYTAFYTNPRINFTISVTWVNDRPLIGQKLHIDSLAYVGAEDYTTTEDKQRTALTFIQFDF